MAIETGSSVPARWPELPASIDFDQLLDIVAVGSKLDRADLKPDSRIEDLGIDSLDMVDMLFEIEDRLGIYVSMNDGLSDAVYLADFIKALASQIGGSPQLSVAPA